VPACGCCPTLGLLISSFRTRAPPRANRAGGRRSPRARWTSTQWTLNNYAQVLGDNASGVNMGKAFINSFVVTVPATIIPILIAAFAAYAFTFMEWKGRDVVFVIIVGLLVVPNQVALVPLLKLYKQLDLNGTFLAVWLAHIGFGMPLAVYILRNYMAGLPKAVIESAKIDGASHFTTFWKLIMPMSTPALASFAIFQFLWVWNDLLVALIFLGRGDNTILTVALQGMQGQTGQGKELIPAAGFITILVPIVVFLALQRFFIRGMTSGAVKG
jgi:alpha-glucoside transport system permease protein